MAIKNHIAKVPTKQIIYEESTAALYPMISLSQLTEDCAMAFFMTSYINSSIFESYLPDLYAQSRYEEDCLRLATEAVAIATFAHRIRSPKYAMHARNTYSKALAQTNAAIANTNTAILDKTLAAVLLLGLFESVAFQGDSSLNNWTSHTFGTLQLLRLRNKRKPENLQLARQLFIHASYNIRISCLQRAKPVPKELIDLEPLAADSHNSRPLAHLVPMLDQVAAIRCKAATGRTPDLVLQALEIDAELGTFATALHEGMPLTPDADGNVPLVQYKDFMNHAFANRRIAKYNNSVRMMRLFLNDFISQGAAAVEAEMAGYMPLSEFGLGDLQATAAKNIMEITRDVLQTIPMYLEHKDNGGKFAPSARVLFWPLSVTLSCTACPESVRALIGAHLDKMGSDLNFPQAAAAAKVQLMDDTITGAKDW